MLLNGLSKGVLMLVLGAVFTWFIVNAFEQRAHEQVSVSRTLDVPSIKHVPGKRADTQWQF